MTENIDVTRKKVKYQSLHRGCKEMDIVLEQFVNKHLDYLTNEEIKIYDLLLGINDTYLYKLITNELTLIDLEFENESMNLLKQTTNLNIVKKLISMMGNNINYK